MEVKWYDPLTCVPSSSVGTLTDCMRSKTLAKFFRDRQAFLKRSLPLGSYLLKPVQRILKYHLLLQVHWSSLPTTFTMGRDGLRELYRIVLVRLRVDCGVLWQGGQNKLHSTFNLARRWQSIVLHITTTQSTPLQRSWLVMLWLFALPFPLSLKGDCQALWPWWGGLWGGAGGHWHHDRGGLVHQWDEEETRARCQAAGQCGYSQGEMNGIWPTPFHLPL